MLFTYIFMTIIRFEKLFLIQRARGRTSLTRKLIPHRIVHISFMLISFAHMNL